MPKISRPIVYTVVGAIAAYVIFLYTQPDTPTGKHPSRYASKSHTVDPNAILPEDLNARFPRYQGGKRDPFVPLVVAKRPQAGTPRSPFSTARSGWSLTGINVVNGVTSALIENSATSDSVFLQPGDHWNGLRVVSVDPNQVIFANALGQRTQLTFAAPPADPSDSPDKPGSTVPPLPTFSAIRPLPPLPPLSPASANAAPASSGSNNQAGQGARQL